MQKKRGGVENFTYIGGDVHFDNLTSTRGLESLIHIGHIGGIAFFNNLKNAEGLEYRLLRKSVGKWRLRGSSPRL